MNMLLRLKLPDSLNRLELYTDGNDDYEYVLKDILPESWIDYGQLIKIRKKGRVVKKVKRVVYGNPCLTAIETTNMENFNGICRERIGRLVRKSKCFSKNNIQLENALSLFQFYWNFMNEFKRKTSPGMMEEMTDHIWSWDEFLTFNFAV